MLILTQQQVAQVFSLQAALEAVRLGAAEYSAGRAQIPLRWRLEVPEAAGGALVMPGYLPRLPALGLKVVAGFPANVTLGIHRSPGVVLLVDSRTGEAEALLDATYLTDLRTGAMTGVACQYLARVGAAVLGLIGTGRQAETQLDAVVATCPILEVRVWSRSAERVARFAETAAARHPKLTIRAAVSAEETVRGADVVVAATTATQPVVADAWVRPGMLVCSVGTNRPEAAEVAPETVARAARVVVDTRRGTLQDVGDIAIPLARGLCDEQRIDELGELVLGTAAARQQDDEIAVFKSVGFAAVDLAAARMIVDAARQRGLGQEVALHS
jgi:ornithine cyclodeaminase